MSAGSTRTRALLAPAIAAIALTAGAPGAQAHHLEDHVKQRDHVEERARSQIGARYSYGGSSPRGFDCSGFTRWVFARHGATLPHSSYEQYEMAERDGFRRVYKRANLKEGDLVFHKTTSARVGHAGIYVGGGKFVSATSSGGVRVQSLYDSYWGPRWVAGTRVPATRRDVD
ncbi:MAG TPA: C40 family peptidase [Actinomycetota bacterium]|nr:C40 family peptidase [Actinomycetota bacterium]